MNKVKMFFIAAALVLTTAGVFAGKAKFATGTIYAYSAGAYTSLASGATLVNLIESGTTPATFKASTSTATYNLYLNDGTYHLLYTNF